MDIKPFVLEDLPQVQALLRQAFQRPESDPRFNEWTFAQRLPADPGYRPGLCLVAREAGEAVGYSALTIAEIGGSQGLALGPLAVKEEYRGRGIGSALVEEGLRRAKEENYPWVAVLGGEYYTRFGFEPAGPYGITVSDVEFENQHLWVLFSGEARAAGRIRYCSAFYDEEGNLL